MSSIEIPRPTWIHVTPHLHHLAVPLRTFLENHPPFSHLVVSAFIFLRLSAISSSAPKLLLVQRSVNERSFPNLWEVPGGSCGVDDQTILHSLTREVFEETGLHLTRIIRQIGDGITFDTGPMSNLKHWLKLSFEVEVLEIGQGLLKVIGDSVKYKGLKALHEEAKFFAFVNVTLDPNEHQAYQWVSEEEIRDSGAREGSLCLTSKDQKLEILQAFQLHNEAIERLKKSFCSSEVPNSVKD